MDKDIEIQDESILFIKNVSYSLTWDRFRRDHCRKDMPEEDALKLWETMLMNTNEDYEVECEDDELYGGDWADEDVANQMTEAAQSIADYYKKLADECDKVEEITKFNDKIEKELNELETIMTA